MHDLRNFRATNESQHTHTQLQYVAMLISSVVVANFQSVNIMYSYNIILPPLALTLSVNTLYTGVEPLLFLTSFSHVPFMRSTSTVSSVASTSYNLLCRYNTCLTTLSTNMKAHKSSLI